MNNTGFTLIEAIASITILGILTVLMVPAIQSANKSIRLQNYETLKKMIIESTIDYFNNSSDARFSLDAVKPACQTNCASRTYNREYQLGEILDKNIYFSDKKDEDGKLTVFNPVTNESMRDMKLNIYYDINSYSLKGNFIEEVNN